MTQTSSCRVISPQLQAEAKSLKANTQPLEGSAAGLLSADIAIVMKENLRMEKLLAACYQVSSVACN